MTERCERTSTTALQEAATTSLNLHSYRYRTRESRSNPTIVRLVIQRILNRGPGARRTKDEGEMEPDSGIRGGLELLASFELYLKYSN